MPGMNGKHDPILVLLLVGCCVAAAAWVATASSWAAPPPEANRSLVDNLDLPALWQDNSPIHWVSPLIGLAAGLVLGRLVAGVLRWTARRLERRGWPTRSRLVVGLAGPLNLALVTLGVQMGLTNLKMSDDLGALGAKIVLLLYSIAAIWYASNLVRLAELLIRRIAGRTDSALDRQLASFVGKTLQWVVLIVGVLFVAQAVFEQNIGAWLAGLGIAGLAVSLAAQDSLKNLFGSITILADRPFQIGESISYGGYDGVVEEIGFRSTKVRTFTGTVVTIPNSKIVNDPVENIARRPYIRRLTNLRLALSNSEAQLHQAADLVRRILEEPGIGEPIHATVDGNAMPPRVFFNEYNLDSYNLLIVYWHVPPAWWDYLAHAERVNLRILEEFGRAGIVLVRPVLPPSGSP